MKISKKLASAMTVVAVLSLVGVAGAATSAIITRGAGPGAAVLKCPGGMTLMGHEVNEQMSIFEYDPAVFIEDVYTSADDGFEVERVTLGSHAGTHLDVPRHFIGPEARGMSDLSAEEFVWPAYKIVASELDINNDEFIEIADIKDYEKDHGRIKKGSLVVLDTGAEPFFGLGVNDHRHVVDGGEDGDLALNDDDLFEYENAGFSYDAVIWLFEKRNIDGVGSDAYGPDAWFDDDPSTGFGATFAALEKDGVALVSLKNVGELNVRGDIIMAPTVAIEEGSGFSTNPVACHGSGNNGHGNDYDD